MRTAADASSPARPGAIAIRGHLPPLDGIRGTAILLVLIYHLSRSFDWSWAISGAPMMMLGYGWVGVDLFFVLSGFLITGILYDAKGEGSYFKNFYARRTLRIFPLYYLGLLFIVALRFAQPALDLWGDQNYGWIAVYMTNVMNSIRDGNSFGIMDHYWSLAVEEHYYLVWPAFVFFLGRRGLLIAATIAMVVAFGLRLSQLSPEGDLPTAAYMLTPMRMDALAAGSFLALLVRGPRGAEPFVKPAFLLAGLAGAGILAVIVGTRSTHIGNGLVGTVGFTLNALLFASFLLISLSWRPASAVMSNPVLRWFGKYSYGLYVWHPIIFVLLFHSALGAPLRGDLSPARILLSVAVGLAVTFIVTMASWHLWEKQFLKLKPRFSGMHGAAASGFAAQGKA